MFCIPIFLTCLWVAHAAGSAHTACKQRADEIDELLRTLDDSE